jgi:hypothetical protein
MSDAKIVAWIVGLCAAGFAVVVPGVMYVRSAKDVPQVQPPKMTMVADPPATQVAVPTRPVATSRPIATKPVQKFAVRGAAWISRGDGSSDVLRGMQVSVLRPTVAPEAANADLAVLRQKWKEEHDVFLNWQAAEKYAKPPAMLKGLKRTSDVLAELDSYTNTTPIDTRKFYTFLYLRGELSPPEFGASLNDTRMFSTKTNVDGRYELIVPEGEYYLHAFAGGRSVFMEWVIPLSVSGEDVSLDLDNSNALVVKTIEALK